MKGRNSNGEEEILFRRKGRMKYDVMSIGEIL